MSVGAAIASGVMSLAGNVIQNYAQDVRDEKARGWQEMMFDKANAYNHPAAVMMRMKQAGLNPNLVAGQPVQGAASVPSASQGSKSASFDDIAPNVVNAFTQSEQLKLQKEETAANIENQRRLTDAEIALKEAEKNEIISRTPKDDAPTIAERTQSESDSSIALQGSQKKSLDDENARKQEEYEYSIYLRGYEERRKKLEERALAAEVGEKEYHSKTYKTERDRELQYMLYRNNLTYEQYRIAETEAQYAIDTFSARVDKEFAERDITDAELQSLWSVLAKNAIFEPYLKREVTPSGRIIYSIKPGSEDEVLDRLQDVNGLNSVGDAISREVGSSGRAMRKLFKAVRSLPK